MHDNYFFSCIILFVNKRDLKTNLLNSYFNLILDTQYLYIFLAHSILREVMLGQKYGFLVTFSCQAVVYLKVIR